MGSQNDTQAADLRAEEPEIEYEQIGNIQVRKDRNCTVRIHYLSNDDGTVSEAYSCEPNEDRTKHPYESYSNEALSNLSYSDAAAAEILGMRLGEKDNDAALKLIIRAAALSGGDANLILNFSNAYPYATAIDGVPVEKTTHTKYVLSAVAQRLGAVENGFLYWHAKVVDISDAPDETLASLDATVQQIIQQMRAIEIEVRGAATIN